MQFEVYLFLTYAIPSSSGEGIPDLLLMLVLRSQATMMEKLTFVNTVEVCPLSINMLISITLFNIEFLTSLDMHHLSRC